MNVPAFDPLLGIDRSNELKKNKKWTFVIGKNPTHVYCMGPCSFTQSNFSNLFFVIHVLTLTMRKDL